MFICIIWLHPALPVWTITSDLVLWAQLSIGNKKNWYDNKMYKIASPFVSGKVKVGFVGKNKNGFVGHPLISVCQSLVASPIQICLDLTRLEALIVNLVAPRSPWGSWFDVEFNRGKVLTLDLGSKFSIQFAAASPVRLNWEELRPGDEGPHGVWHIWPPWCILYSIYWMQICK